MDPKRQMEGKEKPMVDGRDAPCCGNAQLEIIRCEFLVRLAAFDKVVLNTLQVNQCQENTGSQESG